MRGLVVAQVGDQGLARQQVAYRGRTPEEAYALLVSNVEDILSQQTSRWQGARLGEAKAAA